MDEPDLLITIKSAEARTKMSEVLDSVLKGSHVLITRNGRRAAILISPEFYEESLKALTGRPTNLLDE
jgi:prevent-host-death family protein